MEIKWKIRDVFPNWWSFAIFVLYIVLFINQGLLVTHSQEPNNKYKYNTEIAVLLTEVIKLSISTIGYCFQQHFFSIFSDISSNLKVLGLYFVPAVLYCIYNNLSYVNLSTFDPTTYSLALNLRVVATGFLFQVIFSRKLTSRQWCALILLTFGCMLKEVNFGDAQVPEPSQMNGKHLRLPLSFQSFLLIGQVMCSCFAGVYNEFLLKSYSQDISIYLQNMFQYFDSIVCLFVLFLFEGEGSPAVLFQVQSYEAFWNYKVLLVVFNNAIIGIVTSFFLRYLNSILKTFAAGFELVITTILSRILFSIPIYMNTVFAIIIVILATVLYSQNPVKKSSSREKLDDI